MKVYVVTGLSGEYTDWRYWIAKIFKDHEKAKKYIKDINKQISLIFKKYGFLNKKYDAWSNTDFKKYEKMSMEIVKLDPKLDMSLTTNIKNIEYIIEENILE